MLDVAAYCARIGYSGPVDPSLATLRALHRAHLLAVPYENLDIHLGRTLPLDPVAAFTKIVERRRGGWCYEMNGLFASILTELGFDVQLLAGTVDRHRHADALEGGHLVLLVTLEGQWLADVGFGDGFLDPLPLEEGTFGHDSLEYRLAREGPRWVFWNHPLGGAARFDVTLTPRRLDEFAAQCHQLQTNPESGFVRATVCQRFTEGGLVVLRGRVLKEIVRGEATDRVLASADELGRVLRTQFGLDLGGEERALWPAIVERHEVWRRTAAGWRDAGA